MTVKEIKITELKEYENNPRFNDGAVDAVAESIRNFGFKVPIIADRNGVIIAGHTRLKAARKLGLQTVPCIIADDLTDAQAQAFRLADNKVAEFSEWDFNKLDAELYALKYANMKRYGFETMELSPDDFGEDFTLTNSDTPLQRTITLTLSPMQYAICETVILLFEDETLHDFGNGHRRTNALFEAIYSDWAAHNNVTE